MKRTLIMATTWLTWWFNAKLSNWRSRNAQPIGPNFQPASGAERKLMAQINRAKSRINAAKKRGDRSQEERWIKEWESAVEAHENMRI